MFVRSWRTVYSAASRVTELLCEENFIKGAVQTEPHEEQEQEEQEQQSSFSNQRQV